MTGSAPAATQAPIDMQALLSEDGFGVCVPEDQLDDIWLVFATKGKSGRVPHVCMSGDCEDLPDIAAWAAAQQFPDDIDLEREDVVARYAAFVAEYCGPDDAPAAPPALTEPALVPGLPRLLGPGEIRPNVPQRVSSGIPGLPGPPGFLVPPPGGGPIPPPPRDDPWGPPLVPPDNDTPQHPVPPPNVIPLPAGLWLLLSALGLGWVVHRRSPRA